ncbi:glycoside hydrolase family 43 protein [Acidiferrimicrobium sp. IK]|uniref:glycoside hydrolase family 43 protein n=1 Tax=Acidiferrimicrobium sp. IK TaxID=2871700 RepID=UPI0021CB4CBD|nr:glycoside hydrolase family 43 protein [Acidiferrimicrobium sp. IK]MCU4186089.1 glycoside hydrolase family 43 protein [Acidiferrimicrobium sp. IK]
MLAGPAAPGDFPDPFVVAVPGGWGAFATNAVGRNVQVRFSPDLNSWEDRPDALPDVASWAVGGFTWSPAVAATPDGWVLWYAVREPVSGRQAISVATCSTWDGPYRDVTTGPVIFQRDEGGSIDPSVFRDSDGTRYLLWKADANALHRPSSLWGAALGSGGASLAGDPVRLLDHDRGWEQPLIEAPSLWSAGGRYWLAYSAGWWESSGYAMGLAVGEGPLGPFTKLTARRPWVSSDRMAAGPGGQEVFADAAGGLRLAYHAWTPGQVGYANGGARTLRIGRVGPVPAADDLPVNSRRWWELWKPAGPAPALPPVTP